MNAMVPCAINDKGVALYTQCAVYIKVVYGTIFKRVG